MDFGVILIAVLIAFNLFIAGFVAMKSIRDKTNQLFVFMVAIMTLWMFSNFFENEARIVGEQGTAFFLRLDFASAPLWFFSILLFSWAFLKKDWRPNWLTTIFLALPAVVYAFFAYTDLIINDITFTGGVVRYGTGPLFSIYGLTIIAYQIAATLLLVWKSIR
ncbi:hypothetical protein KBD18_01370, partial [Patescibacteria group bacterium]|nr:hypothetical protein [Patescibacteria group bacterium]